MVSATANNATEVVIVDAGSLIITGLTNANYMLNI